ncbi:ABC transporter ATP-binding protein [Lachnospiraceae bacterium JLR.KK008]
MSFKDVWEKASYIFNRKQKIRLVWLVMILFAEIFLELLGVISVYPFIALILNPNMIQENRLLLMAYQISGAENNNDFFMIMAIGMIGIYIFKNAFNAFTSYKRTGFVFDTQREIGVRLMRSYMQEPYSFFLEKNSAVLMRGVGTDVAQFFNLVLQCLYMFSDCVMMLIFGGYMLYTDFILSVSMIVIMVLFVAIFVRWNKRRATFFGKETQKCSGKMTQWMQQAFGGVKEIKILRREDYFVDNYEKYCSQSNRMNRIFSFLNSIPHMVLECFCTAAILLIIALRVRNGANVAVFLPKMAIFAMALFRLFPRISRINGCLNSIIFSYPYMDSVYEALQVSEEHKYQRVQREQVGKNENELSFEHDVTLENIHFVYPNTETEVLSGVNMSIQKGQAVAFVGPSGAGKTTLADVFLGILELKEGRVLCDGKEILNHADEWADKLGYIPQTIFLSDDTIRNNVAFGLEVDESVDDKVWSALEQAQLKEFVERLPEGLDTKIGERGVRLSGGQRQRIGIARALYTNPDILVLDEATSALDNETEAAVMEAIEHLLGHKTMIIIAHRITTVRNCDVIYRVDKGNIEKVTYEQLQAEVEQES